MAIAPEQGVRFPVLRATWTTQTFLHWPYPPGRVQELLPRGLTVQRYEGAAWVSLTPFVMAGARGPGARARLPGLATFPETNLRTYVRGPDGRDGLWFFSLEVTWRPMLAARALGVPYRLGRLQVTRGGDRVRYTGARSGGFPWYRLTVRPGAPITPSARDVWLTGRWRAYSRRLGVCWRVPVHHEPWTLRRATVETLEETLTVAAGLPPPSDEPVVHFSSGVGCARLGVFRPCLPRRPTG
ncbi:YqjF family protein [Streptomyces alkaliterrae]|uniref:YqjF family protein n=1 Tax=Streptomyces alkaliterrae TaxID=2213162 RepID=UPI00389AD504